MKPTLPLCTHIKTDGVRCGSPAMRGRPFCFFHRRYYDGTAIRPDRYVPTRDFPMIRSQYDANTCITSTIRYFHEGRITSQEAETIMNGIRMAANLLRPKKEAKSNNRAQ